MPHTPAFIVPIYLLLLSNASTALKYDGILDTHGLSKTNEKFMKRLTQRK